MFAKILADGDMFLSVRIKKERIVIYGRSSSSPYLAKR